MRYLQNNQEYQEFGRQCEKCREDLMLEGLPSAIKGSVDALQNIFIACLATIEHRTLEPTVADRLQAFNVEINKQLKLLRTDCLFLQTAKQSATIAHRQAQMLKRLDLVKTYGNAILEL
jgi:hypothetical protein